MAVIEKRGESVRVNWRLGGKRDGARQSCTFTGDPAATASKDRIAQAMKLAKAADSMIEARGRSITRDQVYEMILGKPDEDASVPTFNQWHKTWLDERSQLRDIQSDVILSYRRILGCRAVPHLGHLRLTSITPEVLRTWVAWMSSSRINVGSKNRRTGDRLLSAATIRRTHAIVHACLAAAVPTYLSVNPAARPAGASKSPSGLPSLVPFEGMFLRPDEIQIISEHCDPHIRDMVYIALRTGLRLGELIALECRNVLFSPSGATILVRRSLKNDGTVGEPKSAKSKRDITVNRAAADVLRRLVKGKKASALVFPSPEGKMWDEGNFRDRYWYKSVAAARRCPEHPPAAPMKPRRGPTRALRHDEVSECPCPTRLHRRPRFHDTRHTHASLLIARGWSAKKIQIRLGHANYQTTMNVYGHLMDSGNEAELDGVDELIGPSALTDAPARISARRRRAESLARRVRHAERRPRLVRR
jgi:integrase